VARLGGGVETTPAPAPTATPAGPTVTAAKIEAFDAMIPKLATRSGEAGPPNKPAAFVLAPPRSGSTLLRVMLGGNPHIFAPPELFMLNYNSMAEREQALGGEESHWLEGLIVGIMSIKTTDANHAASYVKEAIARGETTKEFYAELQSWIGNRLLVDKSPAYAYDRRVMERAEMDFLNAKFIHLTRHPYATIKSYVDAKIDLLLRRMADKAVPFSGREIAEMIYIICHRNILEFLDQIPPNRQYRLSFEELVNHPRTEAERLCHMLGVPFDEGMLQPYKEKRQRMTEGVRHGSKMIGDVKFHNYDAIDPSVADAWRTSHQVDFLSHEGWDIANRLGYQRQELASRDEEKEAEAVASGEEELDIDNMSEAEIDAMLSQFE
jgi:hypothetical protein